MRLSTVFLFVKISPYKLVEFKLTFIVKIFPHKLVEFKLTLKFCCYKPASEEAHEYCWMC